MSSLGSPFNTWKEDMSELDRRLLELEIKLDELDNKLDTLLNMVEESDWI